MPDELRKYGEDVDVRVNDHREHDFVPPKPKVKAFSGTGHRLGSVAPEVVSSSATAASAAASASAAPPPTNVDTSKPTTKIQLRLADGTRSVVVLGGRLGGDEGEGGRCADIRLSFSLLQNGWKLQRDADCGRHSSLCVQVGIRPAGLQQNSGVDAVCLTPPLLLLIIPPLSLSPAAS